MKSQTQKRRTTNELYPVEVVYKAQVAFLHAAQRITEFPQLFQRIIPRLGVLVCIELISATNAHFSNSIKFTVTLPFHIPLHTYQLR